jgi:hypothetical protein
MTPSLNAPSARYHSRWRGAIPLIASYWQSKSSMQSADGWVGIPLERRQRPALHMVHFACPVVQFAVQVMASIVERVKPSDLNVQRVNSRQLLGQRCPHSVPDKRDSFRLICKP